MFAEMWMERIAAELGRPGWEVRAANLYNEGDVTHFGQVWGGVGRRRGWRTERHDRPQSITAARQV